MKKIKKQVCCPTVLIILDGFAIPKNKKISAINPETAPNIYNYLKKYPNSRLKTYGEFVGLFPDQQGNSEAGHLNIGAGRIIKQDLSIISEAIENGTFFKNTAFKEALFHAKKYKKAVHVMGLLTNGNSAHSYPDHLYALLEYFRQEGQKEVYLHLFTDGRDSSPQGAVDFLQELRKYMNNGEKIATIMGRFYAMDRNKLWNRTKQAYEAMVLGKGCTANSAEEALTQSYNRGETDEYICPTVILEKGKPVATIKDNDVIYFFNARSDRARQITKVFVQPDFEKINPGAFVRKKLPQNIRFVAMSDFGPDLPGILTAFPSYVITNTLPMVLKNKKQVYIAESEKYAHVTYFINGGYADPVNGEIRIKIDSPLVKTYDEKPEMSAYLVTEEILNCLKENKLDFYCVNFANTDMVGHTGNLEAAKKAVYAVDECVKKIVDEVLARDGQVIITADHGNADIMINEKTGEVMTEHTLNLVPFILISKKLKNIKLKNGILADVTPTLLKMLNIEKPAEMTGRALY